MSDAILHRLRLFATWGGWLVSIFGVIYSFTHSADPTGPSITLVGVIVAGLGNFAGAEISRRQSAASRLNDPHLKRLVDDAAFDDYLRHEMD